MAVRVLGLMSGTSVDGVDAAVADLVLEGDVVRIGLAGHTTLHWPGSLRDRILDVLVPARTSVAEICRLDRDLGVALGEIATAALTELDAGPVDLVASHGQTIHHDVGPDGAVRGTLQIGQPAEIAERVGVPVVADFRVRDVAAGGQGAPLVSILDQLLLSGSGEPAGLLNLGGIANLTAVRPGRPTIAFDCGPANALLDAALAQATGERYDAGGARTARGTVDQALLDVLLDDPYLAAAPPKSTGKERYNREFLGSALQRAPVRDLDDLLATIAEAAAAAVGADVRQLGLTRVWASGGGVHNAGLMAALNRRLEAVGATLATTATLGLPSDHKEAYAFALLGWLTWHGLPGSLASCTGASGGRILGTVVPGSEPLRLPEPEPMMPSRLVVESR
ncbi:MAG TPA: anhydro-N-acetylmuramic acid kinase [Jiangellaceae bacterium]